MLSGYNLISITHKNFQLDQLGDFIIPFEREEKLYGFLEQVMKESGVQELMYVATCNRVVLLVYDNRLPLDTDALVERCFSHVQLDGIQKLKAGMEVYHNLDAVTQLMRIASSMDSLVVGEREIFRQIRQGYSACQKRSLVGDNLRILMKVVVKCAKEIYTHTSIGDKPVSVASLAFSFLKRDGLDSKNIAMIGAGMTQTLMSKFLKKEEFNFVDIYNRTQSRAASLAKELKGRGFSLAQLGVHKEEYHVWITCTGSPQVVLTEEIFQKHSASLERICIVDLAVPRDTAEAVINNSKVTYIHIEDLEKVSEYNLSQRSEALKQAEVLIHKNGNAFISIFQQRQIEKVFKNLPIQMEELKVRALENVFKEDISSLDSNGKEIVHKIIEYFTRKSINIPIKTAKGIIHQND